MKTACPKCGRRTVVEDEIGDFPTRCERCGALVRRHTAGGEETMETLHSGSVEATKRIARGALAGLLRSRSDEAPPVVIAAQEGGVAMLADSAAERRGILRPESRRVVARAHARQQALRRAELRGNHQALGALTWAGLVLAVLLGLGALVLKAQALLQHPTEARADVLRVEQ